MEYPSNTYSNNDTNAISYHVTHHTFLSNDRDKIDIHTTMTQDHTFYHIQVHDPHSYNQNDTRLHDSIQSLTQDT